MKELSQSESAKVAFDPVTRQYRDYKSEKPVSDEVFDVFKRLYGYDKTAPLNPIVESVQDSELWKKEKITYGDERVPAYLFLPKKTSPPYQTLIFFPGVSAFWPRPSEPNLLYMDFIAPLLEGGRAVLCPVYKGSYERASVPFPTIRIPTERRDLIVQFTKDFLRSVDYLQTRQDIDQHNLGYVGLSLGAQRGPALLALEDRMRTGILIHGGLPMGRPLPEVDPFNFASHVTIPILMINGRFDPTYPVETSQLPLFDLLGTPLPNKVRLEYERAHQGPSKDELRKQMHAWLDKYLGPVK
ncbi:MAG: hypothetical protein HYY23_07575 [Verrucomicrobia bacterium]|nr:hypothetical protein [Verrucomicrobiota bacterium]